MENIYQQIRQEVSDYVNNAIEIVSGYTLDTYQTIKRCHLYYNSRYEDNTLFNGREKLFYNINKYRAKVASRMLNIDTKNIRLLPLNPKSKLSTILLAKELEYWMKINKIGQFLNKLVTLAPIYGTVIFKKTKKGAQIMDLRRLAFDPTVENICDSRFVIIKHFLTDSELRDRVSSQGWDSKAVEEIIAKDKVRNTNAPVAYPMRDSNQTNIIRSTVYHEIDERYGEVPKEWLTGKEKDSEEMVKAVFIVGNAGWYDKGEDSGVSYTRENGCILFKSEWKKKLPFGQYNYDSTEGRLLGVGVIEDLFPAQVRENEIANQKRSSMELSSMHIFQTSDQSIVQNILTDLQNGDVIRSGQGGFQPLVNEERNLAGFTNEEQRYNDLADRLSFAYDVTRGETLPSSTPATNAVIQNTNSTSEFTFRRENLCLVLQEYFNDLVIPQVIKDMSAEHILRYTGTNQELEAFDNIYAEELANEKIALGEADVSGGEADRQALISQIKQELKRKGRYRFVTVKDHLYNDTEFEFDININNEQKDMALVAQNTFSILTAIAQNPSILENPVLKPLFYKYAETVGVNPLELEYASQNAMQQNPQQQMPQMPANQPVTQNAYGS